MQEKPSDRAPSPRAIPYECGRTIHLLPLERALAAPVNERLPKAVRETLPPSIADLDGAVSEDGKVSDAAVEAYTLDAIGALLAYAAWDEDSIKWDVGLDQDDVLTLKGYALVDAAEQCRRALLSPSATRIGLVPHSVIIAGYRCVGGRHGLTDEEKPPPGEVEPAES